jgi:hypothetical protein
MDYLVQCGTTAILNPNLPRLAEDLRGELQHTGYVREPTVVGNLLTRRLTLTARIEAGTPQTAITWPRPPCSHTCADTARSTAWSASSTRTRTQSPAHAQRDRAGVALARRAHAQQ